MGRKKNKKRNKYTTAGRVDMSKGGRVSKQIGGLPSVPSREQIEKFVRDQNIIDERNISRNVAVKIPAHNIPAFKPAKVFINGVKSKVEVA